MNSIDDIRVVYRDPHAKLEALEKAAATARQIMAEVSAARERLVESRASLILLATDAELAKHNDREEHAALTIQRAEALAVACEARAAELRAQTAEARKTERYEAVAAESDAFVREIESDHAELTRIALRMVERCAKRQLKIDEVNGDLPQGRAPLPSAEDFRRVPDIPSKMINLRTIDLWVDERNQPLSPKDEKRVQIQPDGRGWLGRYRETDDRGYPAQNLEKIFITKKTFVEFERQAAQCFRNPGNFACELVIPALYGETRPGWAPQDVFRYPDSVLRELARPGGKLDPLPAPRRETHQMLLEQFERNYGPLSEAAE